MIDINLITKYKGCYWHAGHIKQRLLIPSHEIAFLRWLLLWSALSFDHSYDPLLLHPLIDTYCQLNLSWITYPDYNSLQKTPLPHLYLHFLHIPLLKLFNLIALPITALSHSTALPLPPALTPLQLPPLKTFWVLCSAQLWCTFLRFPLQTLLWQYSTLPTMPLKAKFLSATVSIV